MRYFIEFAYNGRDFCGWQRQPHMLSVQQVMEEKMSLLLGETITLTGAGRTDSGVHARQMFAHFDTNVPLSVQLLTRLNAFLPSSISAMAFYEVGSEAHARFDATARSYAYYISFKKDPFHGDFAYYLYHQLDVQAMNAACQILLSYTDFQCFSKVKTDVKTFRCQIMHAHWEQLESKMVFHIKADRFLRNMVRAIVGTMLLIGQGKISLNEFEGIIRSKSRSNAGFSVPAQGLFLTEVAYPAGYLGKKFA